MALESRIYQLLNDQLIRELTEEELMELNHWVEQSEANGLLLQDLDSDELLARYLHEFHPENWNLRQTRMERKIFNNNTTTGNVVHRVHFLKNTWFRYAAAIIIVFGLGALTYLWNRYTVQTGQATNTQPVPVKNDVNPGFNRAVLTLSDGKRVVLDSVAGRTIQDGNYSIDNQDGRLVYKKGEAVGMNTMSTPKGGQYQLTLSDGSKVWLNAASSITYPTVFSGKNREVSVTGEAYFEVTSNKVKPFLVKTNNEVITVLGTSFNVNSYIDEPEGKITLINGAVKVNEILLKPGQAYSNGKIVLTNIEQDVAWKNGLFNFENVDLKEAMRQISRWYDLEVVYEGNIPDIHFVGKMTRNISLNSVLKILEGAGVRFKLGGPRTLIVY